ncbi:MAG: cyclic nucleotide-binding domain-containing protein [Alphaproteobacteria bacterium]
MPAFEVRRVAGEKEHEALFAFRYAVYVSELSMTEEADHERRLLRDAYDEIAINYAVFEDGAVVGSLRIIPMEAVADQGPFRGNYAMGPALDTFGPAAVITSGRFMVAKYLRRSRAILRLIRLSFEEGVARGVRFNFGDCSPHLLSFYEQLGYRRFTDGYNDTAFGYKLPIVMIARDLEFLRRVRSPLRTVVPEDQDDTEARQWFLRTYPDYAELETATFMRGEAFYELLADRLAEDPLQRIALLRNLDQSEAERVVARGTVVKLKPGSKVVRGGDLDNTLYAVLAGIVEVKREGDAGPPVAIFGPGDTFGEIGFLTQTPRTADVLARTEAEILVLSGDALERLMGEEPAIAAIVMRNLAEELAGRLSLASASAQ